MTLVGLLVALGVLTIIALFAYWIINKFLSEAVRPIALMIVGLILLVILLTVMFPDVGAYRIWGR